MTTGAAWNVADPLKPWAYFDPDAIRDIAFEWDVWLAAIDADYASHEITVESGLEVVDEDEADGVITVRIKKADAATLTAGRLYTVHCHIVASDGQEDDQTLYLRIIEK